MISFTHISHLSSAFETWYRVGLTFFLILSERTLPPFCGNTPTLARSSFLDKFSVWRPPLPPDRSSRTSKLPTTDGARTSHHTLNPSKQITAYEASQHFKCAHHLVDMIHFSCDCVLRNRRHFCPSRSRKGPQTEYLSHSRGEPGPMTVLEA